MVEPSGRHKTGAGNFSKWERILATSACLPCPIPNRFIPSAQQNGAGSFHTLGCKAHMPALLYKCYSKIIYNVLSIISSISVHNFHFYIWTMLHSRSKMPMAVTIKNTVFWDVTYCSPTEIKWCFGEICYLHLHGRKVNTQCHISNSSNLTLMFHSVITFARFEVMPYHACSLTKTQPLTPTSIQHMLRTGQALHSCRKNEEQTVTTDYISQHTVYSRI